MTLDEFIDSVAISYGDESRDGKARIKKLVPSCLNFLLARDEWEFLILPAVLTSSGSQDYVDAPEGFNRVHNIRHANYEEELTYITPQEYNRLKAQSTSGSGTEATMYTIKAGEYVGAPPRLYFYPPFTSAVSIYLDYLPVLDSIGVHQLPLYFLECLKSFVIYRLTPPVLDIGGIKQYNQAFTTAKFDYQATLNDLRAQQKLQPARVNRVRLDNISRNKYAYFHAN